MFYVQNISIYMNLGGIGRETLYFLFIVKKKKQYKSMTYTKIKFYIILIS